MKIIVNISDAKTSCNPDDVLATYSLGSCIGVTLYDAQKKIGGMLHFQLPTPRTKTAQNQKNPFMFADSGLELLLKELIRLGVNKKNLEIKIAGGAQMLSDAKMFNIGKRNHTAVRRIFWKHGMFISKEDVGGQSARTMFLDMKDGTVTIKSREGDRVL